MEESAQHSSRSAAMEAEPFEIGVHIHPRDVDGDGAAGSFKVYGA
jgi:hypothetical protein